MASTYEFGEYATIQSFMHLFSFVFSIILSQVLCNYLKVQNLPRNDLRPKENSTCKRGTCLRLTQENSWGLDDGLVILLAHWAMDVSPRAMFSSCIETKSFSWMPVLKPGRRNSWAERDVIICLLIKSLREGGIFSIILQISDFTYQQTC